MDWPAVLLFCFIGGIMAAKPTLRPSQESVEKSQNESYVVFCSFNTTEEKGQWLGPDDKPVKLNSGRVHVEDRGRLGLALMFDRIDAQDKGIYKCKSATGDKTSFQLHVIKIPQFIDTPSNHNVKEFHDTTIKCKVVGEPTPILTWQRNGRPVQSKKYVQDVNGLKIINATKNDSGVFTCRAIQTGQEASFIQTVDIIFRVQHKPEWKGDKGEVNVYGYLTGETNLTCEAIAEPEANYSWSRVNSANTALPANTTEISESGRSVLKMIVHNDSYGDYKCSAGNKFGKISKMFLLRPGEKPDPPRSIEFVSSNVHNATLRISSEVKDLVGYRVQFVLKLPGVQVTWDKPHYQDLPKTEDGQYVVVDLLENTSYEARVATRGPAGLSDYSNDTVTFRTLKYGETNTATRAIYGSWLAIVVLLLQTTFH